MGRPCVIRIPNEGRDRIFQKCATLAEAEAIAEKKNREMDGHVYASGYTADPEYVNNLKKEMK